MIELKSRNLNESGSRTFNKYVQLESLVKVVNQKEIPDNMVIEVNSRLEKVNSLNDDDKSLGKVAKQVTVEILNLLEKELGLVAINHFRNKWMAIGMAVFGIPLGVAFSTSMGNMAFLGIGIPVGMTIGMAVGKGKDNEAQANGLQLDFEMRY